MSLCFEDINLQDNEELKFILKIVNLVFAVLFTVEMILKWFAFGLNKYFSSVWTCLDFVIVLVRRHLCSHCTVTVNLQYVSGFRPEFSSGGKFKSHSFQVSEDPQGSPALASDIPVAGNEGDIFIVLLSEMSRSNTAGNGRF